MSTAEPVNVTEAAKALIADVRRRYPGEELHCQYMRALDAALSHVQAPAPVAAPVQVKAEVDGLDWVNIARVAGTHGIRYRTNQGLVDFLNAIALSAISGDTSNG